MYKSIMTIPSTCKTLCLPFTGFYESLIDGEVQHVITTEIEELDSVDYDESTDGYAIAVAELEDFSYNGTADLSCTQGLKITNAKAIAWDYSKWVLGELDIDYMNLKLESPKEYNFSTDRITMAVDVTQLHPLVNADGEYDDTMWEWLVDRARERFTSHPGFRSFYDPDITRLKDVPYPQWNSAYLDLVLEYMCGLEWGEDMNFNFENDMACAWLGATGSEYINNLVINC